MLRLCVPWSEARRLAVDGFRVAILSPSGQGEALAGELGGFGVTSSNTSSDDLKRLVDGALAKWGRIDALVNSAGTGRGRRSPRYPTGSGMTASTPVSLTSSARSP